MNLAKAQRARPIPGAAANVRNAARYLGQEELSTIIVIPMSFRGMLLSIIAMFCAANAIQKRQLKETFRRLLNRTGLEPRKPGSRSRVGSRARKHRATAKKFRVK